jgi:hypothetical protein
MSRMAARVTLKATNDELAGLGTITRLAKASGYFYFQFGEAVDWIDRTVQVAKVSDLTLEQWLGEYKRLKKVNAKIMSGGTQPTRRNARKARVSQNRK